VGRVAHLKDQRGDGGDDGEIIAEADVSGHTVPLEDIIPGYPNRTGTPFPPNDSEMSSRTAGTRLSSSMMAWNRSVSSLDHQECPLQNLILGIPVPGNQEAMRSFASTAGRIAMLMADLMVVLMALIIALKVAPTFHFQSKNCVVISLKNWFQDSVSCSKEETGHSTVVISSKGIVQAARNLQRLVVVALAIVVFMFQNFWKEAKRACFFKRELRSRFNGYPARSPSPLSLLLVGVVFHQTITFSKSTILCS
jgi:hypothetical protein